MFEYNVELKNSALEYLYFLKGNVLGIVPANLFGNSIANGFDEPFSKIISLR